MSKKYIRRIVFGLLGMLVLIQLAGAQSISNCLLIADAESKLPLMNATVNSGNFTGGTDSLGAICLPKTAGSKRLTISITGYLPLSVNSWSAGDTLFLQKDLRAMEELVVTGTMRAVTRAQSPVPVSVFRESFFQQNPGPSIFEGLQQVNGVRPQLNCNICNTGDIHINGLEGPYTMISIDGMPIVSGLSSVYGLFGIPTQMIDRVEIIKGPASGLYGSEAVGGLINIITKSPDKAPALSAELMATSWGEITLDAGWVAGRKGKTSSLTGIHYYNFQQPTDKNEDGFTDLTLQHRFSLFEKFQWSQRRGKPISLAARLFYEDRWGGEMNWRPSFRESDSIYAESIFTSRAELLANYPLPVAEDMTLRVSATWHNQNSAYGQQAFDAVQQISFGQFLWNKQLGKKHHLLSGLAYKFEYYDDGTVATFDSVGKRNRPFQYHTPGLFVQDEWSLSEKQILLLGLRYDRHPVHGNIFTPRLAWKYGFPSGTNLRLNAGTGFRVVNLFTEEHAALTGAREVIVEETLRPEKSFNVNLQSDLHPRIGRHRFDIDLSAWYTYFKNQIIPDYTTNSNAIIFRNLNGYAQSMGVAADLEWRPGNRLSVTMGATVQDVSAFREEQGRKLRRRPLLTENWSGKASLRWQWPAIDATIDYTLAIYGPMDLPLLSALDPRPARSPIWNLQNIQFSKRMGTRLEFFAGVKNLLNWTPGKNLPFLIARTEDPFDKQVDYAPNGDVRPTAQNPYALSFDPSYVYAPNQGRRLFLGLRYRR